jgi:hypothetical protein
MPNTSQSTQRTIDAPPLAPVLSKPLPNRVFSVMLKSDEDVEWTRTTSPDGVNYLSGYTIVKAAHSKGSAPYPSTSRAPRHIYNIGNHSPVPSARRWISRGDNGRSRSEAVRLLVLRVLRA